MTLARSTQARIGFHAALVAFSLSLFFGLREPEYRNDESIYSYSVERILDTGEWLTVRSIPGDGPFYEKPPLKFWIVAAGMKAGILPRNEAGMRSVDALFGALGFAYVYWLGVALGGPVAALVGLLVLFTLDPLLFEHGLRSNNMEASVFLAYCGGIFHFYRWKTGTSASGSRHALATSLYFTLGFMTKFVAALFLPIVCVVVLLWDGSLVSKVRERWRDWALAILAALVLILPWFIYETFHDGDAFWHEIFFKHVVTRLTASLDPTHLQPWHYYFTSLWTELDYSRSQIITGIGMVSLAVATFRGQSFLARLLFVWFVLPTVLISLGTSKLIHYAYPFWPPVGIGAGYAFAIGLRKLDSERVASAGAWLRRFLPRLVVWTERGAARRTFIVLAIVAVSLSLVTAIHGMVSLEIGSVTLFRNSSVLRPFLFAAVFLLISAYARTPIQLAGIIALSFTLPFLTYVDKVQRFGRIDHPLRAAQECILRVNAGGARTGPGVLNASGVVHHAYYFYFWRTGPWVGNGEASLDEVLARLTYEGSQTPVVYARQDYEALRARAADAANRPGEPSVDPRLLKVVPTLTTSVAVEDRVVMLFPGPFSRCVGDVLAAGGKSLEPKQVAAAR